MAGDRQDNVYLTMVTSAAQSSPELSATEAFSTANRQVTELRAAIDQFNQAVGNGLEVDPAYEQDLLNDLMRDYTGQGEVKLVAEFARDSDYSARYRDQRGNVYGYPIEVEVTVGNMDSYIASIRAAAEAAQTLRNQVSQADNLSDTQLEHMNAQIELLGRRTLADGLLQVGTQRG